MFQVTVMKGEEKHSVFDLTSKVIDFCVITESDSNPSTLIILAEEELALVDLTAETWPIVHRHVHIFQLEKKGVSCTIRQRFNDLKVTVPRDGAVGTPGRRLPFACFPA